MGRDKKITDRSMPIHYPPKSSSERMSGLAPLRFCTSCRQWFGVVRFDRLKEITSAPVPQNVLVLCGSCFETVPNMQVLKRLESDWLKVWTPPLEAKS